MSLFGNLGNLLQSTLGSIAGENGAAMLSQMLGKTGFGDLNGLLAQLQQGGLGDQVKTWLGSGANAPVTPEQLQSALGGEQVKQLAAQFGIPVDTVLQQLAAHLPETVDKASPNGTLQV